MTTEHSHWKNRQKKGEGKESAYVEKFQNDNANNKIESSSYDYEFKEYYSSSHVGSVVRNVLSQHLYPLLIV